MYELTKIEMYLQVNLLGPGPRLMEKITYRAAVSQRFRDTGLYSHTFGVTEGNRDRLRLVWSVLRLGTQPNTYKSKETLQIYKLPVRV